MAQSKENESLSELGRLLPIKEIILEVLVEELLETIDSYDPLTINSIPYYEYLVLLKRLCKIIKGEAELVIEKEKNNTKKEESFNQYYRYIEEQLNNLKYSDQSTFIDIFRQVKIYLECRQFPMFEDTVLAEDIFNPEYQRLLPILKEIVKTIEKIIYNSNLDFRELNNHLKKTLKSRYMAGKPQEYFTWMRPDEMLDRLYYNLKEKDIIRCQLQTFFKAFSGEKFDKSLDIAWVKEGSKFKEVTSVTSLFHFIVTLQKKNHIKEILKIDSKSSLRDNRDAYKIIHHVFTLPNGERFCNLRNHWQEYLKLKKHDHFDLIENAIP